jgi:HEAT repeat protein
MRNLLFVILPAVVVFVGACTESRTQLRISDETARIDLRRLGVRAVDIVREGLVDENNFVKDRAIKVVSMAGRKELMPMVIQVLKEDAVAIRFAAIEAIGDMRYLAAQYSLRRLLNDTNENIKIGAAYALTRLGKGDFSDIIRRSTKSKDQIARANAVMLLGKLGRKGDMQLLYQTIRALDSDDKVKIRAVEAIATLGDEKIYQSKCWPLLISKYHDDRIMGIKAMGQLGTDEAKNAIKTMLYDDIVEVRLYAAGQLGELGDTTGEDEVAVYLSQNLQNKDEWSVAGDTAVAAIGQIGTDALAKSLPVFIDSRNKLIRLSAAQSVLLLTQ